MARRDASSHHELESTSNKGALRRAKVGRVLRVPPDNIDDGRERVILPNPMTNCGKQVGGKPE